jgi:hypothetical protein
MLRRALRYLRPEPTRPQLAWLTRDLAIGGAQASPDWAKAHAAGVRGVIGLSVTRDGDGAAVRALGMRYLGLCLEARDVPTPEELHLLAWWANERMAEGGRVVVHDVLRRGNDGLVATAALVAGGLPAHLALQALHRARTDMRLDFAQSGALVRFAATHP